MFEKASEEYGKMISEGMQIEKGSITSYTLSSAILGFKDGANFGYKTANEWHYVKDGDLPKDEDYKWCISRRGYPYIAKYEELFVSWRSQENKDVLCPYAWKEIILPEELKEGEV